MVKMLRFLLLAFLMQLSATSGFTPTVLSAVGSAKSLVNQAKPSLVAVQSSKNSVNNIDDDGLGEKFGGYTVKQRLREEIESPFRQVRLFFFGGSSLSALVALYFSALSALKASMGGYVDAMPMDEALQSCAINLGAVAVCVTLAYRDYQAGNANLERIAQGGRLARLVVAPASNTKARATLKDYRRTSRVILAAGGKEYLSELARSLNADQRADENTLPAMLESVEVVVVPILIDADSNVADSKTAWLNTVAEEGDRNFDIERANDILAFPVGTAAWAEFLESELETAKKQGFDVLSKGINIVVKKNGRILRRATGQPQWEGFIETMEVMDGSKFGMPGDSEKYGGP